MTTLEPFYRVPRAGPDLRPGVAFVFAFVAAILLTVAMPAQAQSPAERISVLERIIAEQQAQLEAQARLLAQIHAELQGMKRSTEDARSTAQAAQVVAEENRENLENRGSGLVASGGDNLEVTLYGQVNRALLYVDDGNQKDVFQVDNDNSSTRIGFKATAQATDDLSIGTKIEVQFESNSTADINQSQNGATIGSNSFTERHIDLFFSSERFGKLSMGQGSTASDNTARVNLSGTTVAGNAAVDESADGLSFVTKGTDSITGNPMIGNVFNEMDGLSRTDRIRYDTPALNGLKAATSWFDGGA